MGNQEIKKRGRRNSERLRVFRGEGLSSGGGGRGKVRRVQKISGSRGEDGNHFKIKGKI